MVEGTSPSRVTPEEAGHLMRLATYASVSVATILILAKLFAWGQSGSVSLLATLVDSVLDVLASLVNLLAVRHALAPADREHRFGHGKAEALAGLGQAVLITGSALFLIFESIQRITRPPSAPAFHQNLEIEAIDVLRETTI